MAGTIEGGRKARDRNLANDPNFYRKIGAIGGKRSSRGGFYSTTCDCDYRPTTHKKAECAGAKGGRISRRVKIERI